MRILVSIFLCIVSCIFVYHHYFLGTDFTKIETIINFIISTILHMLAFSVLLKLAGIKFDFTKDIDEDEDDS